MAYWLFGYAFAFGVESNGFIGHKFFALADLPADKYSHWFFHFVFAATAATIVSGAMAERTEFKAYLLYSVFLTGKFQILFLIFVGWYQGLQFSTSHWYIYFSPSGFVYPIVTHWAWDENGWLYKGVEYTKDNVTMTVAYQVRFK